MDRQPAHLHGTLILRDATAPMRAGLETLETSAEAPGSRASWRRGVADALLGPALTLPLSGTSATPLAASVLIADCDGSGARAREVGKTTPSVGLCGQHSRGHANALRLDWPSTGAESHTAARCHRRDAMENRERAASGALAGTNARAPTKAVVLLSPFSGDVTLPKLPNGKPPVRKPGSPPGQEEDAMADPPKPARPPAASLALREQIVTAARGPEYDVRLHELEKALFPSIAPGTQQHAPSATPLRASADLDRQPQPSPEGRLPRLYILESLSALQKGSGCASPHRCAETRGAAAPLRLPMPALLPLAGASASCPPCLLSDADGRPPLH